MAIATFNVTAGPPPPPPPPPSDTIVDNFDDNSLDTALWVRDNVFSGSTQMRVFPSPRSTSGWRLVRFRRTRPATTNPYSADGLLREVHAGAACANSRLERGLLECYASATAIRTIASGYIRLTLTCEREIVTAPRLIRARCPTIRPHTSSFASPTMRQTERCSGRWRQPTAPSQGNGPH